MKASIAMTKAKNALKELSAAKGELFSIRQSSAISPEEYMEIIELRVKLFGIITRLEMLLKGGEQ